MPRSLFLVLLSATTLYAQIKAPEPPEPLQKRADLGASPDEIKTYDCAINITRLITSDIGPVFQREALTLTSIMARDASRLLIASAGSGIYAFKLPKDGINRMRFALKGRDGTPVPYFVSYMHGGISRSRLFEFSTYRPPTGRVLADYAEVSAVRAPQLREHFEYALFETADNALKAFVDGQNRDASANTRVAKPCESIVAIRPKALMLEILFSAEPVAPVGSRLPASL